jgi:hypothetical protein
MSKPNLDTYLKKIQVGDLVITKKNNTLLKKSSFRLVTAIPPFQCVNYVYEEGFRIQVGEKSYVNIPVWWLEDSVKNAKANGGIYNKSILELIAKKEVKNKSCLVHALAGILVKAGIAIQVSARDFKIRI